jgi:hypothetical protein
MKPANSYRSFRSLASFAVGTSIALAAPLAAAQGATQPTARQTPDYVEKNLGGDAVVTFVGDELASPPGGAYGDTIRRPPGVTRLALIRPRMNFVVELLKTDENL